MKPEEDPEKETELSKLLRSIEITPSIHKTYIGDGVYAEMDPETRMITLTTEDGIRSTNTIYLEPEIWYQLKTWVEGKQK